MEKFRKDIKIPLIKMSVKDPDLLYEAMADIPDYLVHNNEKKDYEFQKIDEIIIELADRWIAEDNKRRSLDTFLYLYKCHSIEKAMELFANSDGKPLKKETINRYRTQAIADVKKWVNDDEKVKEKIRKAIEEQYDESTRR